MQLVNKFREYLLEEEFKLTILKNKVNAVNYQKIGHFDSNKIEIYYQDGCVVITGKSLVVSRLVQDEILVTGVIKNIELR